MKIVFLIASCLVFTSSASVRTDCGTRLTTSSGSFSSPNYPDPYGDSLKCTWTITTLPNTVISIIFTRFEIEPDYDYVLIYDGPTETSPLLANYSGFSIPPGVESKSNNVLIILQSDELYSYTGFLAYYNSYPPGATAPPTAPPCGETLIGEGYIQTPNHPSNYPDDIDCYWYLQSNNLSLTLTFFNFETETFNDYVTAYDGWTTDDPIILNEFSGSWPGEFEIETSNVTDKLLVHFHSDYSVSMRGFKAYFN